MCTIEQQQTPMPSPLSITMSIDKPIYSLKDSKEPCLQFKATSNIDRPITIFIRGSILDPDSGNVWKKSAQHQLFSATETSTGLKVSLPTEIRCGPGYIHVEDFLTIQPRSTYSISQQCFILSNWTRKDPDKPWKFTPSRSGGEERIRYFKPGYTYRLSLNNQPLPPTKGQPYQPDAKAPYQISLSWWYGTKEELLASIIGQQTKLRDLPPPQSHVRIGGLPDVEVTIEE